VADDLRAGIEALRSDLGEWSDAIAGGVAYPTPAEQSASATLENVIAQLDALLAAHPVQVTTAEELDALPVVVADEWTDLARDHPVYRPRTFISDRPEETP